VGHDPSVLNPTLAARSGRYNLASSRGFSSTCEFEVFEHSIFKEMLRRPVESSRIGAVRVPKDSVRRKETHVDRRLEDNIE
jgi:hypothetical protein